MEDKKEILKKIKANISDIAWKKITTERGWVAQDLSGTWYWYSRKPNKSDKIKSWIPQGGATLCLFRDSQKENWDKTLTRAKES